MIITSAETDIAATNTENYALLMQTSQTMMTNKVMYDCYNYDLHQHCRFDKKTLSVTDPERDDHRRSNICINADQYDMWPTDF